MNHNSALPEIAIVINPDAPKNRVGGAVVGGIGNALDGALTHKEGASEQSNFHNYRNYIQPFTLETPKSQG